MSQHSPQQWFKLEEHFFKDVDQQLVNRMRSEMEKAASAKEIMRVTGLNDEKLAEGIAELNVTADTLAAFRLAPLVAVAWADDRVEENERYAITKAAEESGIGKDDAAMALLNSWTSRRPPGELLDAWCDYAKTLVASLAEEHRLSIQKEIVEHVKAVAQASGGFLKFGSISPSERAIIERIETALS